MATYMAKKRTTTNCQTHSHKRAIFSSHLSPTIHCGGPSRRSASQAGESRHCLISQRRRRKRRSFKGLRSFPCLQALAGKIKCLHSVSPALFQMPPLPFKRPSWARMANEQFWILAIYSFSYSLCHSQSPTPSLM